LSQQDPPAHTETSERAAISNAVVRIHARHYGRGPTKIRTHMHDDFALVVLEDILTPAERTLARAGRFDHVLNMRQAFQETLETEFKGTVEEITGRRVRAFVSQVSMDPELAIELFLFEPQQRDADAAPQEARRPHG
jgi:uncharacterized protein YbcI